MPYQFTLPSSSGSDFDSAGHLPLVVYFYPKDSTPGCTTEGLDFEPPVAGISGFGLYGGGYFARGVKSHQNFVPNRASDLEFIERQR